MLWRRRDPKIGIHRARSPRPAAGPFAAAGGRQQIVVGAVVALSAAVAAGATAYEGGSAHPRPASASLMAVTRISCRDSPELLALELPAELLPVSVSAAAARLALKANAPTARPIAARTV